MPTFTFHNPSGSAYFTMETLRNSDFTGSNPDHIVQSDYIFAQVIPTGTSSFFFTGSVTIPTSSVYFRGTGMFNMIVTV